MRSMEVSFLSPEERQNFVGVCIFRKEKANAFPELRTMQMRLSDEQGGSDTDPIEEFDCSSFMTSEKHARDFLRYALKVRQLVDHGIKFETTPQSAMNLEPGEYFRVASKSTHTDRFNNGSVDDKDISEARVYKCESLSYAEDGLVEVSGSASPLNDKGQLMLLDWQENDSDFVEETF